MNPDLRIECFQPDRRRPLQLMVDLHSVLQAAEKPLSLGEVSERLGRPFRAVQGALSTACGDGLVDRLDGGLYELRRAPGLLELFEVVRACEAEWDLDRRLGLLPPRRA